MLYLQNCKTSVLSAIQSPTWYLLASGRPTSEKVRVWSCRRSVSRLNTGQQLSSRKMQSADPEPIGRLDNISTCTIYFYILFLLITKKIPKHLKYIVIFM